MPKDSHLLPPWSQALLRAARMGQVFRPPAPPVEEDKEPGEDEDADGVNEEGFVATKWGLVPKHLEGPEPEFLAKRRKGLSSLYGAVSGAVDASNQMRKTKIKKLDTEGHEYVLEALVPEGQTVEGEVAAEETTLSEAPAPGTVVDGVGVVNADGVVIAENQVQPIPPRRKPPPPKRKAKGPGRGRKKKVAFATGANGNVPSQDPNGPSSSAVNGEGAAQVHGDGDRTTVDGDIEMGEESLLQDGEEGTEDEEEGEEGEEGDREDGELSPSPDPASVSPPKQPADPEPEPKEEPMLIEPDSTVAEAPPKRDPSSSPDLPLAAGQSLQPPAISVHPADNIDFSQLVSVPEPQAAPSIDPPGAPLGAPLFEPVSTQDPPQLPEPVFVETPPPPPPSSPPAAPQIPESVQVEESPQPVSIEDSYQMTEPAVEAALPVEHNPLEGLSEPTAATNEEATMNEPASGDLHFPDGEEDLLGSLERHLDKRS